MARFVSTCDHCGQADDHPKVHLGGVTKHHDCLSYAEEDMLVESAQAEGTGPKASAVIRACKEGARGDQLLTLIQDPEALPQSEGLAAKAAAQAAPRDVAAELDRELGDLVFDYGEDALARAIARLEASK